ncbi:MAG: PTS system mannose/fructose/sorbose family transporter subunit IID [Erysipelotrichaceae bacterium]|nr:PTS system mannose/fructose/sorbose family transporter subunit IID [Erysipelotrichaceae bacterium]
MSKERNYGNLTEKTYKRFMFEATAAQTGAYPGSGANTLPLCRILIPVLKECYPGQDELIDAKLTRYINEYFNTESTVGASIYGAMTAVEASRVPDATDIADNLKIALMGPFAGIGDSIFKVGGKVIFSTMAGYMAIDGNLVGLLICFAWSCVTLYCRRMFIRMGYEMGAGFINSLSDQLNLITSTIGIMGLVVIGNCIPSTVKLTTKLQYGYAPEGEEIKYTTVQSILDSVFPYLLPCLATYAMYKLLGLKGMTTQKLIWGVMAFFIVLSFFKIV